MNHLIDYVNSQSLTCSLVRMGDGHEGIWNLVPPDPRLPAVGKEQAIGGLPAVSYCPNSPGQYLDRYRP